MCVWDVTIHPMTQFPSHKPTAKAAEIKTMIPPDTCILENIMYVSGCRHKGSVPEQYLFHIMLRKTDTINNMPEDYKSYHKYEQVHDYVIQLCDCVWCYLIISDHSVSVFIHTTLALLI